LISFIYSCMFRPLQQLTFLSFAVGFAHSRSVSVLCYRFLFSCARFDAAFWSRCARYLRTISIVLCPVTACTSSSLQPASDNCTAAV